MGVNASIIVCTRNRAESLARTLAAIIALDRTGVDDVELVVVDNGSTDATADVISRAQTCSPFPLVVLREERPGLSRARNRAIAAARHPVLLFTDDDCLPDPDWLTVTAAFFAEDPCQVIGGLAVDPPGLDGSPEAAFPSIRTAGRLCDVGALYGFAMGANLALGRAVIDRIGWFDERFGAGTRLRAAEDTDLIYRAFQAGIPVRFEPASRVLHDHRRSRQEIERIYRNYFIGEGALALKHLPRDGGALLKARWWFLHSQWRGWREGRWPFGRFVDSLLAYLHGAALWAAGGWRGRS